MEHYAGINVSLEETRERVRRGRAGEGLEYVFLRIASLLHQSPKRKPIVY